MVRLTRFHHWQGDAMSRLTFKDKAKCHVRPPGYSTLVEFVLAVQEGNTPTEETLATLAAAFTAIVRGKTPNAGNWSPLTPAAIAKALQLSKRGRKPATLHTIGKPVAVAAEVLREVRSNIGKRGAVGNALGVVANRRYPRLIDSTERVRKQFEKYKDVAGAVIDLERQAPKRKKTSPKRRIKPR